MVVARLALMLHKTPDEIRMMSVPDMDLITYLVYCDEKRGKEEAQIRSEMNKM